MQLSTLFRSQGEGGNPLARREAGETTPSRGCSCLPLGRGQSVLAYHECPQGSLLSTELQAPSITPQDHPLAGSCSRCDGRRTHARRFRTTSHIALLLRRRGRPRAPWFPRARTRTKQPVAPHPPGRKVRWEIPSAHAALEQYSLSARSASGASLQKTTFGGGTTQDDVLEVTSNLRGLPTTSSRRPHGDQNVSK